MLDVPLGSWERLAFRPGEENTCVTSACCVVELRPEPGPVCLALRGARLRIVRQANAVYVSSNHRPVDWWSAGYFRADHRRLFLELRRAARLSRSAGDAWKSFARVQTRRIRFQTAVHQRRGSPVDPPADGQV